MFADLNKLDFYKKIPKSDIDIITITEVLEHLQSPFDTLRYIVENKKQSTKIFVSVPNGGSMGKIILPVVNKQAFYEQDKEHLYSFNHITLKNLLKASGLKNVKVLPYVQESHHKVLLSRFPEYASGFVGIGN